MNNKHYLAVSYSTLIVRFLNIFFLVALPLLFFNQPQYLSALPLVGFSGFIIIFFLLFSEKITIYIMRFVWLINIITGVSFIVIFTGILESITFFYMLALLTGLSLVTTEVYNLRLATNSPRVHELRKNLGNFNFLRVFGIALGFFVAGLVAGGAFSNMVAYICLVLFNSLLIVLSMYWFYSNSEMSLIGPKSRFINKDFMDIVRIKRYPKETKIGLLFIIIDLTIFTFWYAFIPYKLEINHHIKSEMIGGLLTIQAITHAFGQLLWQKIITCLGSAKSFVISISLHILIIFVITSAIPFNISTLIILFIIMGTVNSGTYLAATSIFYGGQYPTSQFSRIGVHQLGSNFGKWLGAIIINLIIN